MLSLASSETSTILSSAGGEIRGFNSGPLLVAGQDNPRRQKPSEHDERQLLRLSGFKEEDVELIKVLFDMYDRDRDGIITVEEACLLCTTLGYHPAESSSIRCAEDGRVTFRQLVQSAGFVRGNHVPPAASGGHTKHFFRMANRNPSEPMTAAQMHSFFRSIGVDIPLPAVERISTTISSDGEVRFTEEELVDHVAYIQGRQDALSHKSAADGAAHKGSGSGAPTPTKRQ